MVEQLDGIDEVADPRPLRRLAVVSASVLVAAVVLLVHEHRRRPEGLPGSTLVLVWVVVLLAGLLLLGAVSGLLARRRGPRRPPLEPHEARAQQEVRALLWRGDGVPPELVDAAQQVVDSEHDQRRTFWSMVVLGVYWTGSAFVYAGRERWWHVCVGLACLAFSVPPILWRRRTIRAAARLGIRPRRGPTRARRSTPRRRP